MKTDAKSRLTAKKAEPQGKPGFLTEADWEALVENGRRVKRARAAGEKYDPWPVVLLRSGNWSWMLASTSPILPGFLIGIEDRCWKTPEFALSPSHLELSYLARFEELAGLERDATFVPEKTIEAYSDEARRVGFLPGGRPYSDPAHAGAQAT